MCVGSPPSLVMVDLPGYGFAFATEEKRLQWTEFMLYYLKARVNLKRVLLLIDSRQGLKISDKEMLAYFERHHIKWQIILTKADLVHERSLCRQIPLIQHELNPFRYQIHPIIPLSALWKQGLDDLRKELTSLRKDRTASPIDTQLQQDNEKYLPTNSCTVSPPPEKKMKRKPIVDSNKFPSAVDSQRSLPSLQEVVQVALSKVCVHMFTKSSCVRFFLFMGLNGTRKGAFYLLWGKISNAALVKTSHQYKQAEATSSRFFNQKNKDVLSETLYLSVYIFCNFVAKIPFFWEAIDVFMALRIGNTFKSNEFLMWNITDVVRHNRNEEMLSRFTTKNADEMPPMKGEDPFAPAKATLVEFDMEHPIEASGSVIPTNTHKETFVHISEKLSKRISSKPTSRDYPPLENLNKGELSEASLGSFTTSFDMEMLEETPHSLEEASTLRKDLPFLSEKPSSSSLVLHKYNDQKRSRLLQSEDFIEVSEKRDEIKSGLLGILPHNSMDYSFKQAADHKLSPFLTNMKRALDRKQRYQLENLDSYSLVHDISRK
ncbi:ribosome biogenesis GTP-binding protein YsxC protein [Cardiosporidium cionae]|uniref:Ribosome biogenesis GTP-binding protein YsxC protein n=1 Tax=Cardiosporidium cionae TaxID=476202 RepID=A0ABQ7J8Z4_9APIC|nr:ribosome biogenesis GTP-binding protein YsxC protein [Cardiosporidium cionae]|eukprot:KAF8820476.1 ribosome biogenesis GTP-binding protein YsxC protein [Cardiosporidium cionae]